MPPPRRNAIQTIVVPGWISLSFSWSGDAFVRMSMTVAFSDDNPALPRTSAMAVCVRFFAAHFWTATASLSGGSNRLPPPRRVSVL